MESLQPLGISPKRGKEGRRGITQCSEIWQNADWRRDYTPQGGGRMPVKNGDNIWSQKKAPLAAYLYYSSLTPRGASASRSPALSPAIAGPDAA